MSAGLRFLLTCFASWTGRRVGRLIVAAHRSGERLRFGEWGGDHPFGWKWSAESISAQPTGAVNVF